MGLSRFQTFNDPPTAPGSLLIAEKVPSSLIRGKNKAQRVFRLLPGILPNWVFEKTVLFNSPPREGKP
jgi:hypothetical protein